MAISGRNFLRVTQAMELVVTKHALARLSRYAGGELDEMTAYAVFEDARQVRHDELRLLGYRPNYHGRLAQGERSYYFRFLLRGRSLVAVLSQVRERDPLVWVTTYAAPEANLASACSLAA